MRYSTEGGGGGAATGAPVAIAAIGVGFDARGVAINGDDSGPTLRVGLKRRVMLIVRCAATTKATDPTTMIAVPPHGAAEVKPALVRLLEWQIDSALETSQYRLTDEYEHDGGNDEEDA